MIPVSRICPNNMWVVDRQKERERIYLRNDIQSISTNVSNVSNEVHRLIAALNQAVGGSPTGADARLIGICQSALQEISSSLQRLNTAYQCANELDVMEWIDDGDSNDFY